MGKTLESIASMRCNLGNVLMSSIPWVGYRFYSQHCIWTSELSTFHIWKAPCS